MTLRILVLLVFMISITSANGQTPAFGKADTLYLSAQWDAARKLYESDFKKKPKSVDAVAEYRLGNCYQALGKHEEAVSHYSKSLGLKPAAPLKGQLNARFARSYSMLNSADKAFVSLDSAIRFGYLSLNELDSLKDYNNLRRDPRFASRHKLVFDAVYPCASNLKAREFDFWIGEWDVYVTGTTTPKVGHSLIQNLAGECLILENWTALGPVPNTGKSMNFYDVSKKAWEQVWMGSGGGLGRFTEGRYEDGAMRFTFSAPDATGKMLPGKFTFFNLGPDKVRQLNETSPDEGKTWQTVYDLTYVRRKK